MIKFLNGNCAFCPIYCLRNSIQTETSSSVKSRIGGGGGGGGSSKSTSDKVTDVRQLLEEKRQGLPQQRSRPPVTTSSKTGWLLTEPKNLDLLFSLLICIDLRLNSKF